MPGPYTLIAYAWLSFGIIWLVAAFANKRTVQRQSISSRFIHLGLGIVAALLLVNNGIRGGILDWRFVPKSLFTAYIGLALTLVGLAFAVWARFHLGRNWSGTVTLKQDHELIRTGPYALVRHPIYSGILLALLGAAIARAELRGLLALAIIIFTFRLKYGIEESFMVRQFGVQYADYRRQVRALIPFVW